MEKDRLLKIPGLSLRDAFQVIDNIGPYCNPYNRLYGLDFWGNEQAEIAEEATADLGDGKREKERLSADAGSVSSGLPGHYFRADERSVIMKGEQSSRLARSMSIAG